MGNGNDRAHFEDYRAQTKVKHEILAAYLPAYFHILKRGSSNVLYIDGFAGRGTYTRADTRETVDGSPLRALKLIAGNRDFAERVSTIFIEADGELFAELDRHVNAFYETHRQIRHPVCMQGTFAARVGEVIEAVEGNLAPTFLFVDPCGVSGTSFKTIRDVMKCDKCEAFIFFNIDGIRRIAGLDEVSDVLVDLLGSQERAEALHGDLRTTTNVLKREGLILSHYREAINKDMGAKYTIAFRVEHEDQQKTSHYLIHATKHPLGFRIMKDVMWRRGHDDYEAGGLEFAQRSRTSFIPLFDLPGDEVKHDILKEVANGPLKVAVFCQDRVSEPENMLCEPAYKKALLELEAASEIEVLGKDGVTPAPANARRNHKGKPTLGNDYWVRLARRVE